ncbi:hypothetical protein TGARI_222050 [Toxoplasma gondii ARI]|uniref:Uncharacterized protein n=1 Tax=Toxoplasma gondii ARI TaxID=1074872 RepID=A0A139XV09_TOXGO|nr:hypothetical protein TGARI_222050 [Toxoplasma gondii ARI]
MKESFMDVSRKGRGSREDEGASCGGTNEEKRELCDPTTGDTNTGVCVSSDTPGAVPGFSPTEANGSPTEKRLGGNSDEGTLSTAEVPGGSSFSPREAGVVTNAGGDASLSGSTQATFCAFCTGEITGWPSRTEADSCPDHQGPENVRLSSACRDRRACTCGGSPQSLEKCAEVEGTKQAGEGGTGEQTESDKGGRDQEKPVCRLRWYLYNVEAILNRLARAESVVSPPFDAKSVGGPLYIRLDPLHPPADETCGNGNRSLSCGSRSTGPTASSTASPSVRQTEGLFPGILKKGGKGANQRFVDRSLGEEKTTFDWDTCRFGVFVACCAYVTMDFSIQMVELGVGKQDFRRNGDEGKLQPPEGVASGEFREPAMAEQSANDKKGGSFQGALCDTRPPGDDRERTPGRVLVDSGRCLYSSRQQGTLWHGVHNFAALSAADRDENLLVLDVIIHSATVETPPVESLEPESEDLVEERGKVVHTGSAESASTSDSRIPEKALATKPNAFLSDAAFDSTRLERETVDSKERPPASSDGSGNIRSGSPAHAGVAPGTEEKVVLGVRGGGNSRVQKCVGRLSGDDGLSQEVDHGGRSRRQPSTRLSVGAAMQGGTRLSNLRKVRIELEQNRGSVEGLGRHNGAKTHAAWNRVKSVSECVDPQAVKGESGHCGVNSGLAKRKGVRCAQVSQLAGRATQAGRNRGKGGREAEARSTLAGQEYHRLQVAEAVEPQRGVEKVAKGRRGGRAHGKSAGAQSRDCQECRPGGGEGTNVAGTGNASAKKKRETQRQQHRTGNSGTAKDGDMARVLAAWGTLREIDGSADAERFGVAVEDFFQDPSAGAGLTGCRPSIWADATGQATTLSRLWEREQGGPPGLGEETAMNVKTAHSRLQAKAARSAPSDTSSVQRCYQDGAAPRHSEDGCWKIDTTRGGGHTLSALNVLLSLAGRDGNEAFGSTAMSSGRSGNSSQISGGVPSPYLSSAFQEKPLACGVSQGNGDQRGLWNPSFEEGADPGLGGTRETAMFLSDQNAYGHASLGSEFHEADPGLGTRGRNFPVAPFPGWPPASRTGLEGRRRDAADVPGAGPMQAGNLTTSLSDTPNEPPVLVQYARALQAAAASSPTQQNRGGAGEDISSGAVFQADRLSGVDLQRGLGQDVLASRQSYDDRIHGEPSLDEMYPSGNPRESSGGQRGSSFYSPGLTALEEEHASRRLARTLLSDCAIPDSSLGACLSNNDAAEMSTEHATTPASEQDAQLWRRNGPDAQTPEERYVGSAGSTASSVVATALDLGLGARCHSGHQVSSSLNVLDAAVAHLRRREGLSFDRGLICGLFSHPIARYPDEDTLEASRRVHQQLTQQEQPAVANAYEQMQTLDGMKDEYSRAPHQRGDSSRSSYGERDARVAQVGETRDHPESEEVTREYALQYLAENIGRIRRDTAEYDSLVGRTSSALRGHSVTVAMLPRASLPKSENSESTRNALPEVPSGDD